MLFILSVLWGGSFFFVGVAVTGLPALTIVLLRVALAAFVLWCIAFLLGQCFPRSSRVWIAFLGIGVLNNVIPFTLIVWGQSQIASGLAAILNAATPIFTVIVAGLLLPDERMSSTKLMGVAIGFVGVTVVVGLPAMGGSGDLLAQVAIVAAALSYAFAGVYGRRFKVLGIHPITTAAGQVTASAVILLPVTLAVDVMPDISSIRLEIWAAVLGLAVFSTAIAYVLYFRILELAGATNLLLVTLLIPVSAILLGAVFLDESLEMAHFLGVALIALGLSVIDGRLWRLRTRAKCKG